jgi:hypothetical protein
MDVLVPTVWGTTYQYWRSITLLADGSDRAVYGMKYLRQLEH